MSQDSKSQPPQPTHSLEAYEIFIGEWEMVGTHPYLPASITGHASFEWLKKDALLAWHSIWEPGKVPSGYSVLGHDDAEEGCTILYTDDRGVARIYKTSLEGKVWKMWRDSADFAQRMTGTFSDDGQSLKVQGEMSRDGGTTWEQDLGVVYTRKA
jgi:hypothetical protein